MMKKLLTILFLLITSATFAQHTYVLKVQGQQGIPLADSVTGYVTPTQLRTKVDTSYRDTLEAINGVHISEITPTHYQIGVNLSTDTTFSNASDDSVSSSLAVKKYVNRVDYVANITSLENYVGNAKTVIVQDTLRGGTFNFISTGTIDSGTVFKAYNGGFWRRNYSGMINVQWFGAVGDGSTDNGHALNQAMRYAYSLSHVAAGSINSYDHRNVYGAKLYFPTGVFLSDSSIEWKDGVKLIGQGKHSSYITFNTGMSLDGLYTTYTTGNPYTQLYAQDISFYGKDTMNVRDIVHIIGCYAHFDDVDVVGAGRYGMYFDGAINSKFERCTFASNTSHNFYLASSVIYSTTVNWDACYFTSSKWGSGVFIENVMGGSFTGGCIFESNGYYGGTADTTGYGLICLRGDIAFYKPHVENNYQGGLWLGKSRVAPTPNYENHFIVFGISSSTNNGKPIIRVDEAVSFGLYGDYPASSLTPVPTGVYQFYPAYASNFNINTNLPDSAIVFYNQSTGLPIAHNSVPYLNTLITKNYGSPITTYFGNNTILSASQYSMPVRPSLGGGDSLKVYAKVQVDSIAALKLNSSDSTIANRVTNLQNTKANDNAVVHLANTELITGTKTFKLLSMSDTANFNGFSVTSGTPSVTLNLVRNGGGGFAAATQQLNIGQYSNAMTQAIQYGVFGSLPSTISYAYLGVGSDASYSLNNLQLYPNKTLGFMVVNDAVGDFLTRNASSGLLTRRTASETLSDIGGAPLASPTFTGTPTSPTASSGTNTTQIATTGFVQNAVTYKPYVAKSTSYTIATTDQTIEVTATGQTFTLPTAVGASGKFYTIKLTVSGTATIATTSSQTIDGATTYTLSAQYKYVTVQSNGSNWVITGNN